MDLVHILEVGFQILSPRERHAGALDRCWCDGPVHVSDPVFFQCCVSTSNGGYMSIVKANGYQFEYIVGRQLNWSELLKPLFSKR